MAFTFEFKQRTVKLGEQEFAFKELSVAENDFCAEAARQPDGDIDPRKMMRLMIAKSSVEPKLSIDDLGALPNRYYLLFAELVNELNTPDDLEEVEAKNG